MSILVIHKKNLSRRRHLAAARGYADRHGERLLLVMHDPSWEREYADLTAVADTSDIEATARVARELAAAETEPIRGVVSFAEAAVPAVARVAAELGLPAVSERTAYLARDKYAMRQAFAADGNVPQPEFGLACDLAEAREVAARIGYPLVLKPILGTGSMYVRSVADDGELAEHLEFIRRGSWAGFEADPLHVRAHQRYGGAVLMEQFVGGAEISVESLVVDGVTHPVAIHDKPLPTGPTFEEVYACTPTRLPAEVVDRLQAATAAVHRALDIRNGPTHVEFRLRDGAEPVILEAAARMGGGPIYRSVLLSTGVDMVEAALDIATGRRPRIEPRTRPQPVGFRNIFPDRPGRLVAVHGVAQATADPRVDEIEIYRQLGDELRVPPRTFQGHGHLIFTVDRPEQLDPVFAELVRTVRLDTAPTTG